MRGAAWIATALALAAGSAVAGAQASYNGPMQVDATNQGEPTLNPVATTSVFTYNPATGVVTLHLAHWNTGNRGRGPQVPYSLNWSFGLEPESLRQGSVWPYPWEYLITGGGGWTEGKPSLGFSYASFYGTDDYGNPDECDQWGPYITTVRL